MKGKTFPFRLASILPSQFLRAGENCFCTPASGRQLALPGCTKHVLRVNHPGPKTRTTTTVRRLAFQSAAPWKFIRAPGLGDSKVRARAADGGPSYFAARPRGRHAVVGSCEKTGPCVQSKRLRSGRLRKAASRDHLLRGVPNESFLAAAEELPRVELSTAEVRLSHT